MFRSRYIISSLVFLCLLIPSPAYSLINMEVFSGYTFGGRIKNLDTTKKASGINYGFRCNALYRIPFVDFGLGGYMQATPLSYSVDDSDYDLFKLSMGIDSFVRYKNDLLPVVPYIRYGLAIYDKSETRVLQTENVTVSEFQFKASYLGGGITYPIVPMPVIDVHLFIEYLYDMSKISDDYYLHCSKINIGLLLAI